MRYRFFRDDNLSHKCNKYRPFAPRLQNCLLFPQNCISQFIEEGGEGDVLDLKVQDPFHRLLLHGVCEV